MDLVLRTPWWHRLLGASGLLIGSFLAVSLTLEFGTTAATAGSVVAAGLALMAWRLCLLRVEIRSGQLVVVNWRQTERRPLLDVRYFSSEVGGWCAIMRDGGLVRADVFGPSMLPALLTHVAELAVSLCQQELHEARSRSLSEDC